MNFIANQTKHGQIKAVNFTIDQSNHGQKKMQQKSIQYITKENLLTLKDLHVHDFSKKQLLFKRYGVWITTFSTNPYFFPTFRVLYYTHCQGTALQ